MRERKRLTSEQHKQFIYRRENTELGEIKDEKNEKSEGRDGADTLTLSDLYPSTCLTSTRT